MPLILCSAPVVEIRYGHGISVVSLVSHMEYVRPSIDTPLAFPLPPTRIPSLLPVDVTWSIVHRTALYVQKSSYICLLNLTYSYSFLWTCTLLLMPMSLAALACPFMLQKVKKALFNQFSLRDRIDSSGSARIETFS